MSRKDTPDQYKKYVEKLPPPGGYYTLPGILPSGLTPINIFKNSGWELTKAMVDDFVPGVFYTDQLEQIKELNDEKHFIFIYFGELNSEQQDFMRSVGNNIVFRHCETPCSERHTLEPIRYIEKKFLDATGDPNSRHRDRYGIDRFYSGNVILPRTNGDPPLAVS